MMRAVLYCRVSDDRQGDNLSLPTQEKACREYAERHGYAVDAVFVDRGESAKTSARPEFQAVIVYGLSRFSRNNADHHAIAALLRGKGVALRSVTEPIDDSPAGRFMEGILASMAQFDNDQRAARTRAGLKAAAERGRWVWPAPLGYRTGSRPAGEPSLVPIPEAAPLIAEAFETFAGSSQSITDVWRAAQAAGLKTKTGLPIPMQSLHNMLRGTVYCGRLRCDSLGIDQAGDWTAMVSEDVWRATQARLDLTRRTAPTRKTDPSFPLRGFVMCDQCGRPLTAGWSRGKMGTRYGYYRCKQNCRGISAARGTVETAFLALLERLRPSPQWLETLRGTILGAWRQECDQASARRSKIEAERGRLEAQLRRLDDAFLDERSIDRETYTTRRDDLRERRHLIELELSAAAIDSIDLDGALAAADLAIETGAAMWAGFRSTEQRRRFQRALLPGGVRWDGRACLNPGNILACYDLSQTTDRPIEDGGPTVGPFELLSAWMTAWSRIRAA
jgi:site-specific DNA recombinase